MKGNPRLKPRATRRATRRNQLKGKIVDNINAMLSGCGFNLRKLVQIVLRLFLRWLFFAFPGKICGLPTPRGLACSIY